MQQDVYQYLPKFSKVILQYFVDIICDTSIFLTICGNIRIYLTSSDVSCVARISTLSLSTDLMPGARMNTPGYLSSPECPKGLPEE